MFDGIRRFLPSRPPDEKVIKNGVINTEEGIPLKSQVVTTVPLKEIEEKAALKKLRADMEKALVADLTLKERAEWVNQIMAEPTKNPPRRVDMYDPIAEVNARAEKMRHIAQNQKAMNKDWEKVWWTEPKDVVTLKQARFEELTLKEAKYDMIIINLRRFMGRLEKENPSLVAEFCEVIFVANDK